MREYLESTLFSAGLTILPARSGLISPWVAAFAAANRPNRRSTGGSGPASRRRGVSKGSHRCVIIGTLVFLGRSSAMMEPRVLEESTPEDVDDL